MDHPDTELRLVARQSTQYQSRSTTFTIDIAEMDLIILLSLQTQA